MIYIKHTFQRQVKIYYFPNELVREDLDMDGLKDHHQTLQQFGQAVRKWREQAGLTLDQLAVKTGISKPYLSNIENAKAPGPPREEKLKRLEEALNVPAGSLIAAAEYLRTPLAVRKMLDAARDAVDGVPRRRDGALDLDAILKSRPPESAPAVTPQVANRPASRSGLSAVPLINKVPAGIAAEYTDLGYPAGVADGYVPAPDAPPDPVTNLPAGQFAVRVTGDSMAPIYTEGDIVVAAMLAPRHGEDCVIRLGELQGFGETLKRVFFVPTPEPGREDGTGATHVRLVPLNPRHPERLVDLAEITGMFPVLWKMTPVRK